MTDDAMREFEKQSKFIIESSIGSRDPYQIAMAKALGDDTVQEEVSKRLEQNILVGAVLRQNEPIAIVEFAFESRSGVNLTNENFLVGIDPNTDEVSVDLPAMLSGKKSPLNMLPLAALVSSDAAPDTLSSAKLDPDSLAREDEYRAKIGQPTLTSLIEASRIINKTSGPAGMRWGQFFGLNPNDDIWGPYGAASPGTSGYTKCFSETNGGGDGYYVNDDCG